LSLELAKWRAVLPVGFCAGQETFHSHLSDDLKEPRQIVCQLKYQTGELRLSQGKQNLRAARVKGKLEFNFLFGAMDSLCPL